MHSDKDQRPSFDELLISLDELHQEITQREEVRPLQDSNAGDIPAP